MKRSCIRALVIAVAGAMQVWSAPIAAGHKDPSLTVKGVGLGTELARVRQILGTPRTELDKPPDETMGMGKLKTLKYQGLTLELCKPEGRAEYHVSSVIVTGKQWVVEPGLHIGMSRDAVIKVLGPPVESSHEPGSSREILSYGFESFDGYYGVTLQRGQAIEISASEDWS